MLGKTRLSVTASTVLLVSLLSIIKGLDEDANDFSPIHLNNEIDSFVYQDREYLLISFDFKPSTASLYCAANFRAQLVEIKTENVALFLADALSETNHYLDNVWTGGKKNKEKWIWPQSNEEVDPVLLEKYYLQRDNETEYNVTRKCLAFRRNTHDKPKFLSLSCRAPRPPVCERKKLSSGEESSVSTHPGWIKIRDRYYKIYQDRVAYDNASKNCIKHDRDARLAVIETTEDAEMLSRYMVIGRPKIENAWIGAKWSAEKEKYEFAEEDIELEHTTNETTRYPPWRGGEMQKKGGCLLLDRHMNGNNSIDVFFVEARCARFRPYICYKRTDPIGAPVFVEDNIRVFNNPKPWGEAVKFCKSFSKPGALPEPRDEETMKKLLYIMGENFTAIHQIWLGGLYEDREWKWTSDNAVIPTNEAYPVWLTNDTFTEDVEDNNRCLNLDRENHNVGIFYGTDCSFPQRFFCVFEGGVPPDATLPEGQIVPGASDSSTTTTTIETSSGGVTTPSLPTGSVTTQATALPTSAVTTASTETTTVEVTWDSNL